VELEGQAILTVEGLADGDRLHPLQQAFVELGAAQCGYCTPGMLLTAHALLARTANPARPQIQQALAGNLCRCTGYAKILDAIELAALRLQQGEAQPAGRGAAGGARCSRRRAERIPEIEPSESQRSSRANTEIEAQPRGTQA
jgi:xanthine dehydrogenase iron-sulfur cluster and FAD-binding subunit A